MPKRFLPFLLIPLGILSGAGAAVFLAAPEEDAQAAVPDTDEADEDIPAAGLEYVKLNNQFVIPVVSRDRISSLVVLSLSIEITAGQRARVFEQEPKLRDAFLRVLFDHANIGGFNGPFTQEDRLGPLRTALREAARAELGKDVRNVLIVDILRQDP
ncbi:flagellar basal body-associated protein FliL [Pontibaca methylaminivorans]|uniref:flagellar basal body-associated protein FliL n=1 Tax=Pontibaca methylaminivorans TaxID=515897 RepID=UPI002FD9CADB